MFNKITNKKIFKIIIIVSLILLPIILELIAFKTLILNKATFIRIALIYAVYTIILGYNIIGKYFGDRIKKILNKILKYRYIIALVVFVILVLFKVNFSSLDMWITYLNEDTNLSSTIIGEPRAIRSDEWLVYTPLMLAQAQNDSWYNQYNSNVEQGNYNMMINNLPVFNLTIISHPLQWGFLLFGMEYGYSWYWAMKMILLFLVSIELVMIITKKNEILSLAGGILLALAPCMMWWLSTSIPDAFIYGIAIIILFHYYVENVQNYKIKNKLLIALGMIITIPGFAMTLYPAYQIPLAYLIAGFLIIDFINHFKQIKKQDYIIMISTLILSLAMVGYFIIISWNDIMVQMNTVYPGARFETGGTFNINNFVQYFTNVFLFSNQAVGNTNACEISTYIYPFAAMLILSIYAITNKKNNIKENKLFVVLSVLFIFFFAWCYIGFNNLFAKITFLYNSQAERTGLVLGLIGTLICLIILSKYKKNEIFTNLQATIITTIIIIASYIILKNSAYYSYFSMIKLEIIFILVFLMTYFLLTTNKNGFSVVILIVALISGLLVNPITIGTKIFTETELYSQIQEIEEENENALWIGHSDTNAQYLLACGVNTLNGTNIYPNFNWLNIVDPEKKYEQIYNRYAHINIELGNETNFELIYGDNYTAVLTYKNIKDLGISYIFTMNEFDINKIEQFKLEEIYSNKDKNQYIYKFN